MGSPFIQPSEARNLSVSVSVSVNQRLLAVSRLKKPWAAPAKTCASQRAPARFIEAEDVLPTLSEKALGYVKSRAAEAKAGKPFFLYLPLPSPHTPIAPTKNGRGKEG